MALPSPRAAVSPPSENLRIPPTPLPQVLSQSIRQKELYPVTGVPAPVKAPDFTEENPLRLVVLPV